MVGGLEFFLSWRGALLLAALDSSLVFYMPLGIDALVIYLAARDERLFWMYPLLATTGSVAGGAVTFWIGRKLGDIGLARFVPPARLERFRGRVRNSGAFALALPAIFPPPFPLTPLVLTCGALRVNHVVFFSAFAVVRLLRFSAGAVLARLYGRGILRVLESPAAQIVVVAFIAFAVVGTLVSAALLWRQTHSRVVVAR